MAELRKGRQTPTQSVVLPYFLNDTPKMVYRSTEDRIVLVTEAKHNGDPIVIVNEVSGKRKRKLDGERIEANATITVFEKALIEGAIKDARLHKRILFVDKKRSQQLVKGEERKSLNSLTKSDFDNNIKQFWDNVNYKIEKKNLKSESIGNDLMKDAIEKAMNGGKSSPRHSIADNYGNSLE